jgi:hypothetical protein
VENAKLTTGVARDRRKMEEADLPTGPKEPKSTRLSLEDEAVIVALPTWKWWVIPIERGPAARRPMENLTVESFAAVEWLERASLIEIADCLITGPLSGFARLITGPSGAFAGHSGSFARLIIGHSGTFERLLTAACRRLPPAPYDEQSEDSHRKNTDE